MAAEQPGLGRTARRSRLRLRPMSRVIAAYLIAPAAGLTALWLLVVGFAVVSGPAALGASLGLVAFFGVYLAVGWTICLVVELMFATPLLWGFARFRWRWLNGWTGALIGFAVAFLITLALTTALSASTADLSEGQTAIIRGGHRTMAGWLEAIGQGGAVGVVGLVTAIVFRLVAVELEPDDPAAVF